MTHALKAALATGGSLLLAGSVQAATIDFGGLSGSNGTVFTGPYVEDGFTVTATGGQVFEGHVFGNPAPSLVTGSAFGGGNLGVVEVTRGTSFTLGSFDQIGNGGTAGYSVQGFLGASLLYTLSGSVGSPFQTVAGNATTVDRLVFTLTPSGSSSNLDNIVLNEVRAGIPEPAAWALMICGFGLAGAAARRTRATLRFATA